ncbi:MAG TPA: ABC transporter permease [Polyangia bacterium]|nr:ABC transporter permease [Polyangia bacterium]
MPSGGVAGAAPGASVAPAPSPHVVHIRPTAGWWDFRLGEVWASRELLWFLVWKDVKVRYKETVIGAAWAVLQPVFTMIVFTIFFGRLAKLPSSGLPYPVFYMAALLPWSYFASALSGCTSAIVENQRIITKVYFPRLLLPLSVVIAGLVDLAIALVVMVPLLIYYGITPTAGLILLPVFVLMATLAALAVGLWLTTLNVMYRDVRYVVPFIIQFLMFASPVIYSASSVPARWQWLYGLNPMVGVIEGFRWAITGAGRPPGLIMIPSFVAVCACLIFGLVFFSRIDGSVADRI